MLGAALIVLQGLAYVTWSLGQDPDPVGILVGLLEPVVGSVIVIRLVRHWPSGVTWTERLR